MTSERLRCALWCAACCWIAFWGGAILGLLAAQLW